MSITTNLSSILVMSSDELKSFAATAPFRYKRYFIEKRDGSGRRLIAHPSKEVKFIQRLLIQLMEKQLTPHFCAHGYVKGKSIVSNALQHRSNPYLLKMDFKDFFLSIKPELLYKCLEREGIALGDDDKEILSGLLFWKLRRSSPLRLSIGAPSSPLISNFVLKGFDEVVFKICHEKGITYTRYADDLTFSTKNKGILFELPRVISREIRKETFGHVKINRKKTVFSSKAHNRHVTGITISNNNNVSVGRDRKRTYSSMIHKFTLELLSPREIENLKGHLAFVKSVEPDFLDRMSKKYGQEVIHQLIRWQP